MWPDQEKPSGSEELSFNILDNDASGFTRRKNSVGTFTTSLNAKSVIDRINARATYYILLSYWAGFPSTLIISIKNRQGCLLIKKDAYPLALNTSCLCLRTDITSISFMDRRLSDVGQEMMLFFLMSFQVFLQRFSPGSFVY